MRHLPSGRASQPTRDYQAYSDWIQVGTASKLELRPFTVNLSATPCKFGPETPIFGEEDVTMAEQLDRIELPQAAEAILTRSPQTGFVRWRPRRRASLNIIACSPIRAAISLVSFCATSRRFRVGSLSSGGRLRRPNAFSVLLSCPSIGIAQPRAWAFSYIFAAAWYAKGRESGDG